MEQRVAIVTGGLRGLGRAMAFGLAREGHSVLAIGHIDADVAEVKAATSGANFPGRILPLVADLRRPAECDRVVATAQQRFGTPQILVNNAGLTFHDDRPGALSPSRAAKILASAGRHRAGGP
jgi:3-oxoacyl-[acyl-carrier protein] reductase